MATILGVNRNTSARLWNVGRNHMRPTGKVDSRTGEPILAPLFIKWGIHVVQVPPKGEYVDRDTRGRSLTPKIVGHLVVHHEGLSDKAPMTLVAASTQPSLEEVASLGVTPPAEPVLEEAVEVLVQDESAEEEIAAVEAALKKPAATKTGKK